MSTVTTTVTTTDTVTNADSGDLLASGSGYVTSGKEGDMDTDWGGQGSASMPSGSSCGSLGTDKCAMITGSGNSTSTMGVPNMGTTFKQTINISNLNISKGGKTTYTIKVDKQDASDSIYMHITGKNGNTTSFAGTDILSAAGTASGYAEYTGSFDFADSLTSLIVEVGGRDINLAIGPMFDDVSINVLYNIVSQIVLQTITTIEQYVYINGDATQEEIDIVKDIFEHNDTIEQPDGSYDLEPIDGGDNNEDSYESVELELELPEIDMDFEVEFDMPDMDIGPPPTMVEIKMESTVEANIEMEMAPKPEMEVTVEVVTEQPADNIEVAVEDTPEPEMEMTEPEPVEETIEEQLDEPIEEEESEESTEEQPVEPTEEQEEIEAPEPEAVEEIKVVEKKKKASKKDKMREIISNKLQNLANEMGEAASLEEQQKLQSLILALLNFNSEFSSYNSQLADSIFYDSKDIYTGRQVPDNQRGLRNGLANEILHNKLVDLQWQK